jgi:putative peptidoglycan lipid II flippase
VTNKNRALWWGISASVLLSLTMLAGRLSGLLRELVLASAFGVTPSADVAVLLLTFPDLLVNLLISGGLSAALVPRFTTLRPEDAKVLFRRASVVILVLFGFFGGALAAWPQAVFTLLAPGLQWPLMSGALSLTAVAIAIPLTGAAGVAGAYLNANHRFFVTGCGTLIFNVCILSALLLARGSSEILTFLAAGIAVGAALRWLSQLATMPDGVWRSQAEGPLVDKALVKAFAAATLASALMLMAPIVVRAMASTIGSGAIASFNYAQKLVELPVGILITSISTVALSRLSALQAQNKSSEAAESVIRDTQYALLIAMAVTVPGLWFADSVVHIVFARGEMGSLALMRVTDLTRVALLSIPCVAISSMAIASLNADKRTHDVLKVTVGSLFILPFLALPGLILSSEQGLMAAVVAFQAIAAVWLARLAKLRLFGSTGVVCPSTWRYLAVAVGAAVLAAALDWAIGMQNHWLRLLLAGCGFFLSVLSVRHFRMSNAKPV